ncbi:MAG: aminopeptidase [Eubacteriales bacterium]|nr:aminopeptidase [Eubacteriales bacterium]
MATKNQYNSEILDFSKGYMEFLDRAKTEREAVAYCVTLLEESGFKPLGNAPLKSGDKVYKVNRGKNIYAAIIGTLPMEKGINLVAAHIDSPRLDLKQNPLYEDSEFAMLRTHYYGGIKKYQWTTIPLALHGVVMRGDGSKLEIALGEDDCDPIFTISDLLPHLAKGDKKMSEVIIGENLTVIAGSIPGDDEKEKAKSAILKLLKEKYSIEDEDFISAELTLVPAFKARDVGFDRSIVAGYGQDDRVCAYTALRAICDMSSPEKTSVIMLADKEEVGSMGATGMMSRFFEDTTAQLCSLATDNYTDITIRTCFSNSTCLSADVGAAMDPNYKEVQEATNAPKFNHGLMLTKYTGARGKAGSSDADAELVSKIRNIFNDNNVAWQIGELGKVDQGGGGTVAQFIANLNIDTIDCGVPLLSMHSPFETAAKFDVYMAYKGYKAFMEECR